MNWTWIATVLTCVLGDMSEIDIYCYAFVLQINDIDWSEILFTSAILAHAPVNAGLFRQLCWPLRSNA